ncbi:hypothetical protein LINPERHAP1_LOCUS13832 [Linum perenne]
MQSAEQQPLLQLEFQPNLPYSFDFMGSSRTQGTDSDLSS